LIRNHPKLGQGLTLEGWCLYLACPSGTSQWDKHNLSQWDRQIGTSCACPSGTSTACPNWGQALCLSQWDKHSLSQLGQANGTSTTCPSGTGRLGQAVLVPVGQAQLVPTGTGKGQKRPLPVPWDKSYTHAGGLTLSWDKLYTHDGACPSSTCPNLSHKVGLQGREKFAEKSFVLFTRILGLL